MTDDSCIGSGYCCSKAPCPVGMRLHGPVAPCPSLVFKDDRFWCGEALKCEEGSEAWVQISDAVGGLGSGCCSNLNSARPSSPFYDPSYAKKLRLTLLSGSNSSSSSRER